MCLFSRHCQISHLPDPVFIVTKLNPCHYNSSWSIFPQVFRQLPDHRKKMFFVRHIFDHPIICIRQNTKLRQIWGHNIRHLRKLPHLSAKLYGEDIKFVSMIPHDRIYQQKGFLLMKCLRNMDHMTDLLFICCKSCIDTVKPCLHLFPGSPKLLHFFRKAHAMIVFISCLCTQHSCRERTRLHAHR